MDPHSNRGTRITWAEVHSRLAASQAAIDRALAPSREEQERILKARAHALARPIEPKNAADESIEIVEFLLAYENYGIESDYVREVYPLRELTPVPGTPPFVLGVANVRGQILSVLDIKKFFELPDKGLTDLNKLIIVQRETMELGILADAIVGVRPVPLRDIQASLPTLTDVRADYLRGVTKERLVVLDAEKILSDERILLREEVEG